LWSSEARFDASALPHLSQVNGRAPGIHTPSYRKVNMFKEWNLSAY
jgi:hypothetical protein